MINRTNKPGLLLIAVLFIPLVSFASGKTGLKDAVIIPKPVSVEAAKGSFSIGKNTAILIAGNSKEALLVGESLAEVLRKSTGYIIPVTSTEKTSVPGNILFRIDNSMMSQENGNEGYILEITKKQVTLTAKTPQGLFRGIQTIRQVLPPAVELQARQSASWTLPAGKIIDYPAYEYRGMMLDVARHFFQVKDVLRVIDYLAYYKMNSLHLHLSDDQGWRIEIKSWPNLTLHGGSTQVGGGKGGYYTQEEYKAIVKYASERYINIVPEIDMPGHTNAALASYAELNCSGKATDLYTGTEVGFSTFCTNKDITYKFIDDVIGELAAMTPGQYMHIGGDESHATKKEDYIPFVSKVEDIVTAHGKKVIGWDEIALTTLKNGAVAQHWASVPNAKLAIGQGSKILMSPATKAYVDMQYDKTTRLGLHWAAYIETDSAYMWDPATLIPGVKKDNIFGVEAALWTETITNIDDLEYMVFPRLPGIAEIGWTPAASRNWNEYKYRIARHGAYMNALSIDYYHSKLIPWPADNSAK